jgi:hypothetical protein
MRPITLPGRPASITSERRRGSAQATGRARCPSLTNFRDLERHARDFAERRGFTYTVLSIGTGDVIGCVYIYPSNSQGPSNAERRQYASVESWVRADHAALDAAVHDAVVAWLERDWPFDSIEYAPRT